MSALCHPQRHSLSLLVAACVGACLLAWHGTLQAMMEWPLRAILMLMQQTGWHVAWKEGAIIMGDVRVPWSDDCAGVSFFAVLPVVSLCIAWRAGRGVSIMRATLIPLALAVMVNVARVGSILSYRLAFAPEVESAQLHSWLGFVWLVPALVVLLPSSQRSAHWLECLHLASVMGLLCPYLSGPGGVVVLASAAALVWRRMTMLTSKTSAWSWIAWCAAAVWIASTKMESLWLAWLLACPWRGLSWWREPFAIVTLAGTVPLCAMQPWAGFIVVPAALLMIAKGWRNHASPPAVTPASMRVLLSCACLVPFIVIGAATHDVDAFAPPDDLQPTVTALNSSELHLSNQPQGMRVDWIGGQGGGRHHTVQVCMAYRGEHLREAQPASPVFTDGSVLRREFFLFPDALINDYPAYLRRTFWPGSDTGVHLIISAAASTMSVESFENECRVLAGRIREHCRSLQPGASS